jgi:RNA polymerase sigma-70 factor (ECF subfamily)
LATKTKIRDFRAEEQELIRRIRSGEKELFHELIAPLERGVYLTALAILQSPADAEDAAQEAVLKAYRNIASFRGEAKFSTWLTKIAINEARQRLRKSRRASEESLDTLTDSEDDNREYSPLLLSDWREVPTEAVERREIRELIESAMGQLTPGLREVLVLRDIEELNIAETAEALGLTESVVKVRLFRARMKLRDLLAPALGEHFKDRRSFWKGIKLWS